MAALSPHTLGDQAAHPSYAGGDRHATVRAAVGLRLVDEVLGRGDTPPEEVRKLILDSFEEDFKTTMRASSDKLLPENAVAGERRGSGPRPKNCSIPPHRVRGHARLHLGCRGRLAVHPFPINLVRQKWRDPLF
jgi:hypothetical protein